MPREVENLQFGKKWEFDEEELLIATVFPVENKRYLESELAVAVETRLAVTFDPLNPALAGLQDAYYRGQADILRFVLGLSNERISELQRMLEEKASKQQTD
jgi:hypothetical protein